MSTVETHHVTPMEIGIRETIQRTAMIHRVPLERQVVNDLAHDLTKSLSRLPYTNRWRNEARTYGDVKITTRERQVLLGIAHGLTAEQIGTRLHLSRDTVKTYLSRAYVALGVHRATQAIAVAIKNGVLTPDEIINP